MAQTTFYMRGLRTLFLYKAFGCNKYDESPSESHCNALVKFEQGVSVSENQTHRSLPEAQRTQD